jgi:hypothetical protein
MQIVCLSNLLAILLQVGTSILTHKPFYCCEIVDSAPLRYKTITVVRSSM